MSQKLIDAIRDAISANQRFFALEFFPPKTAEGESNLYPRLEKMTRQLRPLWCSLTCGPTAADAAATLNIGRTAQSILSVDTQLNLTAALPRADVDTFLAGAKAAGVRNVMLLQGVQQPGEQRDFEHAVDLVRYVRSTYGAYFGIAVAADPDAMNRPDYEQQLKYLREKVDAGADLIITSMVFSAPRFLQYCADCRRAGIACPIVPGIMPVQSRAQFRHWLQREDCAELRNQLDDVKHDDAEVKRVGVAFTASLVKQLLRSGVRGVYFFTNNMETVVSRIVEQCHLSSLPQKDMPWVQSRDAGRQQKERQRPIFWSGRPTSYMARTHAWDEFTNGRFGDAMSPAFGEDTTYHTALALTASAKQCHWMYTATTLTDVCAGFVSFLEGRGRLPWCEEVLAPEADLLLESTLKPLNRRGVLTINSQPAVNGVPSDDARCGWGPSGGYVYQRQYLEFFVSPEALDAVLQAFDSFPQLTYMAMNADASTTRTNATRPAEEQCTVTWGCFPDTQIQQPTTVSMVAFKAWVPEAFSVWSLPFSYGPRSSSSVNLDSCAVMPDSPHTPTPGLGAAPCTPSCAPMPRVLQSIAESWFLVNVVDNDHVSRPTRLDAAVAQICATLPVVA